MRVGDIIYLVHQGKNGEEIQEEEIIDATLLNDSRIIYNTQSIAFDKGGLNFSIIIFIFE